MQLIKYLMKIGCIECMDQTNIVNPFMARITVIIFSCSIQAQYFLDNQVLLDSY